MKAEALEYKNYDPNKIFEESLDKIKAMNFSIPVPDFLKDTSDIKEEPCNV